MHRLGTVHACDQPTNIVTPFGSQYGPHHCVTESHTKQC